MDERAVGEGGQVGQLDAGEGKGETPGDREEGGERKEQEGRAWKDATWQGWER